MTMTTEVFLGSRRSGKSTCLLERMWEAHERGEDVICITADERMADHLFKQACSEGYPMPPECFRSAYSIDKRGPVRGFTLFVDEVDLVLQRVFDMYGKVEAATLTDDADPVTLPLREIHFYDDEDEA